MLEIPKQSQEGLHQLAIDIKTKLQGKPLSEAPLVLQESNHSSFYLFKLIILVFICGAVAGIGYILITDPASLVVRFVQIWEFLTGWI